MRIVTYDALRSFGVPGVSAVLKPERYLQDLSVLSSAGVVLYPPTWLVNPLVYALHRHTFPNPVGYHLGYDKIEQTRAFQALCPRHVPETLITRANASGAHAAIEQLGLPLVVKRPRDSMGRGVALIETPGELDQWIAGVEVLYAQERLPIDRDLRVVWVGDAIVAAYWRVAAPGEFHNNIARGGRLAFDPVPPEVLDVVARVSRALGLDHAGFDVALVDDRVYLLEFNLLFGNEGLNQAGISLGPVIGDYLARTMRA